jgi:hypothetical protein
MSGARAFTTRNARSGCSVIPAESRSAAGGLRLREFPCPGQGGGLQPARRRHDRPRLRFLHLGRIDDFAELQQRIDEGLIEVTSDATSLTLAFGSGPGEDDTLTIVGINDLQAGD